MLLLSTFVSCASTQASRGSTSSHSAKKGAETQGRSSGSQEEAAKPELVEPSPYDWPQVVAIRQQARELLREQAKSYWQYWTRGEVLDLDEAYAKAASLFSPASLQTLRQAREQAARRPNLQDDVRALLALELFVAGEIISSATAKLSEEIHQIEVDATLRLGRFEMPFRELEGLLASEGSAEARARLYASALPTLQKLNPLLLERQRISDDLARELGFDGYAALGSQLRGAELGQLKALAKATLDETDDLYAPAMEGLSTAELSLPLEKLRRADIPRLFRGPGLQNFAPPGGWQQAAFRTFAALGLDLESQPALRLDLSAHPQKHPRAVCFPVDVPDDIRVSVKPQGSLVDIRSLLHELGHAQAWLNSRRPEWELRQLGNSAVAEAWAFLFDGLWDNPSWLEWQGISAADSQHLVRSNAVQKLYTLRRYAAKMLFEIDWHTDNLTLPPEDAYARQLSRAYGFPLDEGDAQHYLVDHDDYFYSADYLRAWYLAAQVEHHLLERFGTEWWAQPEAGELLISLWREGTRLDVDEIAQRLGDVGLEPGHLWDSLRARLGSF